MSSQTDRIRRRFVTAASLFDGHDASINIMRRLLQQKGVEVIHLGHNRSAKEVVDAALQEDAHAIALSSYQGGHMEYFTYIRKLLDEKNAQNIKIFGGGGGVITPKEIQSLHDQGIEKIYSPEDGMNMGLEGIIDDMISKSKVNVENTAYFKKLNEKKSEDFSYVDIAKVISYIENYGESPIEIKINNKTPILGITGTGGAGKSTLIDELLLRFNTYLPEKKIALISVDPTRKRTKGALLGDRIRLNSASFNQFYIRSLATRDSNNELSPEIELTTNFLKSLNFDLIIVETSGIGQASDQITNISDFCAYIMTPEYGAQTQLEKIEMLEAADYVIVNKYEKARALDAIRDVRKQFRRNKKLFSNHNNSIRDNDLPVYGTIASQFNDTAVNSLFCDLIENILNIKQEELKHEIKVSKDKTSISRAKVIPTDRVNYLREISKNVRDYNERTIKGTSLLDKIEALSKTIDITGDNEQIIKIKTELEKEFQSTFSEKALKEIDELQDKFEELNSGELKLKIKNKEFRKQTKFESLSGSFISKIGYPKNLSLSQKFEFLRKENLPGSFPFAAGVFPLKKEGEDPKRQFAGEGGPGRTNKRFHYLSKNDKAKRLSTAFDSVTLYGEDPATRPDIYGKIGESGVSICTLEDMIDLFDGFDLTDPFTSVSKTINGPAPIILAMFLNAALSKKINIYDTEVKPEQLNDILKQVRGTVQADILKEDQAQNTCIFSLEFSLKLMGDVQEYFSKNLIKKYYTVSISGYHIAEAGANPITQLAFTLANGFTYVEYYLSRGIPIDDFCNNLSFFFSNGLDPEYTVIGRVARKIWAITLRDKYGANLSSQRLKYHIQTSGRSLHAGEIDFNDIRTTLQAFLAISDNCNSLHTNAYDEAITTPTEESVRRAMAIQMIIGKEFGLNKTVNPLQGSYAFNELSDIVEEYVLQEFERISDRGGVLGAMETMYQRGKIQEESLLYETKKDSGELPIIGINTYVSDDISQKMTQEIDLTRASNEEKNMQIERLNKFKQKHKDQSLQALENLKEVVLKNENIFEELLKTVRYCSLGQITEVLFELGGKYRRNM